MLRMSKLGLPAITLASLMMAFALSTPAMAAAVTQESGPAGSASIATPPNIITTQYTCDLSAYGSSAPVTVSATLAFAGSVAPGNPLGVTLNTPSVTLPSSVLGSLSGVTSFDLAANVSAQHATAASVPLSGTSPVSGTLTGLPASKATGSVKFPSTGTGVITVPAKSLTFTPHQSHGTSAAITCTTSATTQDISVTATTAVVGTTGPEYKCVTTVDGASSAIMAHVPMTVTSAGGHATGKTDTVTLAAGTGAYPSAATSPSFAADLPVHGAQPGKIALSTAISDLMSPVVRASGHLSLTKAGTDQILTPETFTMRFAVKPTGVSAPVPVVIACTMGTSPAPVGLTIKVAQGPAQSQSGSGGSGNGGQPEGSGQPLGTGLQQETGQSQGIPLAVRVPQGAPATGGGSGPGADLAMAVGGLAMALAGGGLVLIGRRRRRLDN